MSLDMPTLPTDPTDVLPGAAEAAPREAAQRTRTTRTAPARRPFREAEFVADFMALIEAARHDDALAFLFEQAQRLIDTRINVREKQGHLLFMSRMIQAGGTSRYGAEKLRRKVAEVEHYVHGLSFRRDGAVLDFGCGAHDPLGLAAYFLLNGASRATALDLRAPRVAAYSALSLYDILASMALEPERYLAPGTTKAAFLDRLAMFTPRKLASGDLEGGYDAARTRLRHVVGELVDSEIAEGELDLVISFAVFEHVEDIRSVNRWLYDHTASGGVHYHFIDLADHRSYTPHGKSDAFSFLTEETAPPSMNRLRKSEHLGAFQEAGFEIVRVQAVEQPVPEATLARFLPPWSQMPAQDQRTIKLRVVLRKP